MRLEIPDSNTVTLDRKHPLCEGSTFAEMDFSIEVKRMEEADIEAALHAHKSVKDKRVVINESAAYIDLFDKAVASWANVCGKGGEPIPCTSENKRQVAKYHPLLRQLVVMASRHASVLPDVEEAEEKN